MVIGKHFCMAVTLFFSHVPHLDSGLTSLLEEIHLQKGERLNC